MTNVPSEYQLYVINAANQLGISPDIVAAQIQTESDWNPNAKSSAGAEGIAQFEPGTFATYGSGSPYNVADAFNAYVKYMKTLMQDEHGNIRDALAAYNAGPANKSAGYAYADDILKQAGSGISSGSSNSDSTSATPTSLSGVSWPDGIIKFFDSISTGTFWMRALMVVGGGILTLYALNNIVGITKKATALANEVTPTGKVAKTVKKVAASRKAAKAAAAKKAAASAKKTAAAQKAAARKTAVAKKATTKKAAAPKTKVSV